MTKHKRNLAVAGGVISSILLSPMLAALAVGELVVVVNEHTVHVKHFLYDVICFAVRVTDRHCFLCK